MSVAVQYVVRPNPGTDPAKITELAKEGAALWRKHGGKVTYWTVAVGEVGNRVLSITFENFAAYGAAVDKMGEDKEVRAWQAKRMKAGYTTWVRSNMATTKCTLWLIRPLIKCTSRLRPSSFARLGELMSPIGTKQTSRAGQAMTGPEGVTDIPRTHRDFAF